MWPSSITAMRSDIESASSWSWVTYIKVMPELGLEELQLDLHLLAQLPIEGAERLVEQQQRGLVHQGAGQGDPLLLSAGELAGLALGEAGHLHHLEDVADPVGGRLAFEALLPKPVGDILGDGHVRKEGVILEDGVDVTAIRRDASHIQARNTNPSLIRLFEAGEHPQSGRLAATGRPEERQELANVDLEIDAIDGDHRAETLGDIHQLDRTDLCHCLQGLAGRQ